MKEALLLILFLVSGHVIAINSDNLHIEVNGPFSVYLNETYYNTTNSIDINLKDIPWEEERIPVGIYVNNALYKYTFL